MNRRLLGAGLLLSAIMALPAVELHAQKKKKKDDAPAAPATDSAKLKAGEFTGLVKTTPGSDRTFTVSLEQVKLVPTGKGGGKGGGNANPGLQRVQQAQARLQQAQAQVAAARTPQQRQQAAARIAQASQQLNQAMATLNGGGAGKAGGAPPGYRYDKSTINVEFQLSEKAKFRTMILPEEFGEKGEIKKYSAAEMAKLRGKDKSLPGYESSLEKLEVGQKVKLVLAAAPAKAAPAKGKDDDKTDEKDDDKAEKAKQVRLVVILAEAAAGASAQPKRKK